MKIAKFNAMCPFEIGDKISKTEIITDIACVNYIKSGKVEFRYELNNSKKYIKFEGVNNEEYTRGFK